MALKVSTKDIHAGGLSLHLTESGETLFEEIKKDLVDFELKGPLDVDLFIEPAGPDFRVKGKLKGNILLTCSRCLASFILPLDMPWEAILSPLSVLKGEEEVELTGEDVEVSFFKDDVIDLSQILRDQIFLSIPWKPLCQEVCKGICPRCGKNLNDGACQCPGTSEGSPFEILNKLKPS